MHRGAALASHAMPPACATTAGRTASATATATTAGASTAAAATSALEFVLSIAFDLLNGLLSCCLEIKWTKRHNKEQHLKRTEHHHFPFRAGVKESHVLL